MNVQIVRKAMVLITNAKIAARTLEICDPGAHLVAVHLDASADDLEQEMLLVAIQSSRDSDGERPIVGDNVKITGGEHIGFIGIYIADRDNGTARYPVVKLRDGTETFVVDPMHLRKL